ncbi:hypothetical protein [Alloactinosynnema sp. L-07]|nr:hypothetical protein [Alloactinosynnema sp. L-07]
MVMGANQIDAFGNQNISCIGPHNPPANCSARAGRRCRRGDPAGHGLAGQRLCLR